MDGPDNPGNSRFRALPQLQRLLELPAAGALASQHSRPALVAALRHALAEARHSLVDPSTIPPGPEALLQHAAATLAAAARPALRRVINASGIALHTNLGRAPLPPEAIEAAAAAARGSCNLEYDLDAGTRGQRQHGVEPLLRTLTGAQAATAVNNCAAAVLLALAALAGGGEVIVSRGELVEIGGGFRIPDVIQQGGARLVEVGTTNKTRLADYEAAITSSTRMLLKVHPGNFRILGFTAGATLPELAVLARTRNLVLMHDLGSGTLASLPHTHEPSVRESVDAGADLVAFSGDKLLGGPQAGLLVGTDAAIGPLRRHPLMRALRPGKMTLAALEATLKLHENPARAAAIPTLRILNQTQAALQTRAERLVAALDGIPAAVEPSHGEAGGGSLPGHAIPSRAVAVAPSGEGAETLARRLRTGHPAIVGRIAHGRLLLDMLAVTDAEVPEIAAALRAALA